MKLRLASLRLRQLALAAASLLVVLAVAGLAFAAIFADHTQRTLETRLAAELNRLVVLVDATTEPPTLTTPLPDARYETPAGGIYWQVLDPASNQMARSRSLWDTTLAADGTNNVIATERVGGPAGQTVLVVSQTLTFEGAAGVERPLQLAVAENLADVEAANADFRSDLLRAFAVITLTLLATYWITVEIGLAPLKRIKQDVTRVRSGEESRLSGSYPTEVVPLVSEVNELLDGQERSIEFARQRAADLAHGLKTSLTLMNGQAFDLKLAGHADAAGRIEQLTDSMTATVDHQLKLSRLRHRVRSDRETTPLAEVAGKVVAAVRATPRGRTLTWTSTIAPAIRVRLDAMDLSELLGIVLENAAEWASSRVTVSAEADDGRASVVVSDDGPGLSDAEIAQLGERGRRLDEARAGSGLGLAIASEIVTLNGGTLGFARAPQGGLAVTITIGTAAAAR
ncbi:MAG: sensor histidine kinase [Devosia sp.]